ncbi:gliding motility-associated C-terminal domain-containing protein [candidate division KSB1 bacterium]|nr:gliding motility-associated C-terminal domain-containing protein [candidate division KSB1 bacterium]
MILFILLSGLTANWAFAFPQDDAAQVINSSSAMSKKRIPPSDSLAKIACDKKKPFFINLDPDSGQVDVALNSIIKFTVVDSILPKKNEWDHFGVDTSKIFISIKTRFWSVEKVKPHKIILVDTIQVVDCEYYPEQPFDWSDTITVTLSATDISYLQNSATKIYDFYTLRDTVAPVLTPIYPLPNMVSVPVDSGITIHCSEEGRGVVWKDVELKINDSRVNPILIGDSLNFTIYYNPESDWLFDETVKVYCKVNDRDGNLDSLDYSFVIEPEPDKTPPVIEPLMPDAEEDSVSVTTAIVFRIWDDKSGVDVDSVYLDITSDSVNVSQGIPLVLQTVMDTMYFQYQPSNSFAHNDEVKIHVHAADKATKPNSADKYYAFKTEPLPPPSVAPDTTSPVIEPVMPVAEEDSVSVATAIIFRVWDDGSGVNVDSVYIDITSDLVNVSQGIPLVLQTVKDTVYFQYQPSGSFAYDDVMKIHVHAADSAGNSADKIYDFWTQPSPQKDTTPPVIEPVDPDSGETNVSVKTAIVFRICDDNSGVNVDSVYIDITSDLVNIQFGKPDTSWWVADTVYFQYQPVNIFACTDEVKIHIHAADKAEKPNRSDKKYSFKTASLPEIADTTDLWFINFTSSAGENPVQAGTPIILTAILKCSFADCPDSFDVCLYFDEKRELAKTKWFQSLLKDEIIIIQDTIAIHEKGKHKIETIVDFSNNVKEFNEDNNFVELYIDVPPIQPELIVRSNPFTPNDDGFNDEVKFDYEQFDVDEPNLKIFDIHGKRITDSEHMEKVGKAFLWNGLDESGREVLPGAYLYIFSDKVKALARGCVVVAR